MPALHLQVTIPYRTGLPEDVAVNNWYFTSSLTAGGMAENCQAAVQAFYEAITPTYWHPILDFSSTQFKGYDPSDPKPRVPVLDEVHDLDIDNDENLALPEEVAMVLSFRSLFVSGIPNARARGRVYLGPVSRATMTTDGGDRSRIDSTVITNVEAAVGTMAGTLASETAHAQNSTELSRWAPVVQYWMDNAFDSQRRRGPDPTTRVTWDA